VKRIVEVSDVVTENMRPGVMDKLGLNYEELRKVRSDIIMLSSSAFGSEGPLKRYGGYAPSFAAYSGLTHLTGYSDGPPNPMTAIPIRPCKRSLRRSPPTVSTAWR